jgi:uracil-DNA glycosylase family 4
MLIEPDKNCSKCKRLKNFRESNIKKYPNWFNGAVPSIINKNSEILIVGLAPGLNGANKTGRPFTGDYAGLTLFNTLKKFSLLKGQYKEDGNDNLRLENCSITNAVRCVPPKNLPKSNEVKNCENFLKSTIFLHKNLKVIIALGLISHKSIISTFNLKQKDYKFGHSNKHDLSKKIKLLDSYHCSRYNINTKRLSQVIFDGIFIETKKIILN